MPTAAPIVWLLPTTIAVHQVQQSPLLPAAHAAADAYCVSVVDL